MSKRPLSARIAILCIPICASLLILNLVPVYSPKSEVTTYVHYDLTTMIPYPIYPDTYVKITFRVTNFGTAPFWVTKMMLIFPWAPETSYTTKGSSQTINGSDYCDFPIVFYVPKEISTDTEYEATLVIVYIESQPVGIVQTGLSHSIRVYVNKPVAMAITTTTVTREVTKEPTKTETIFTQPPPKPEPLIDTQTVTAVVGVAVAIIALILGYYQWYLPRTESRKKEEREEAEKRLSELYSPLYEILRRAKDENTRQRNYIRTQLPSNDGPRNYVLDQSELNKVHEILERSGHYLEQGRRERIARDLGNCDGPFKYFDNVYYRLRDSEFDPHTSFVKSKSDELTNKLGCG